MARSPLEHAEAALRGFALGFPEAVEEFPWGERVIKVGGKIFVFLGEIEGRLRVGMKLPVSAEMALTLPFTEPTGYGLGRAGWVTARFGSGDDVPVDLLREWIAQSYRAVAPKKLVKALDASPANAGKEAAMTRPGRPQGHRLPRGRSFAPRSPAERQPDALWIFGFHPAIAVLGNPRRTIKRIVATPNALARLKEAGANLPVAAEETTPRLLDHLLGGEAVHQGIAIEVAPLPAASIEALPASARLVVVLDQVTDPHNVGAIIRSAVAFGADALVTTGRHAPVETGVLAKAASGALELLAHIEVQNLARALEALGAAGFTRVGLDSEAAETLETAMEGERIALVLGAEGKGLRRLTRDLCDRLARLPTVGTIASLNVSNAAVLGLYIARRHLDGGQG